MSIIVTIIEIVVCLIILGIIGRYIAFTLDIANLILPNFILKFIILCIALSVVQYLISRKDD